MQVWKSALRRSEPFRQHLDQFSAASIMAVHIYVDYYLGFVFVAQILTLLLLFVLLMTCSPKRPWRQPRTLWLWLLFGVLTLFPVLHTADVLDGLHYCYDVIFGALVFFWLGLAVGRGTGDLRTLFSILALLATLLAVQLVADNMQSRNTRHIVGSSSMPEGAEREIQQRKERYEENKSS